MEIAVDLAVEIAVEIAMASVMGLHGVPLLVAAFRGSPWNVRGSPWSVRGCPWNAVEISVECRGGPWALPRCSAKKTNNVQCYHDFSLSKLEFLPHSPPLNLTCFPVYVGNPDEILSIQFYLRLFRYWNDMIALLSSLFQVVEFYRLLNMRQGPVQTTQKLSGILSEIQKEKQN